MTTTPVVTITDEQIAEIEAQCLKCEQQGGAVLMSSDSLSSLISRLRAAEKYAERYQWLLREAWFQEAFDRFDPDDGGMQDRFELCVASIIDAAMEQSE